jgi:protein tyrosine/serine phosphatase
MERPALLHCKSGADRSGFAAALYLMLAEGRPVTQARRQLSLRYGHNRFGRAGLLDAFFDAYARETGKTPMPLMEWVETVYDPDRIAAGSTRNSRAP